jgi:hypothetical protein
MPAKARVKWTQASLRRALEDEKAFDVARRCCGDGVTDQQIRKRIAWLLNWQRLRPGEPHRCRCCGGPTNEATGEVVVQGQFDGLWYRAVCHSCADARNEWRQPSSQPSTRTS